MTFHQAGLKSPLSELGHLNGKHQTSKCANGTRISTSTD